MNFSLLAVNNNRSKAYLQNLIKNNFIPNKIIVLDNNKNNLIEATENDKLISKFTKQKSIKKIIELNIWFDEKEHILTSIKNNGIKFCIIDSLDVNSQKVINEINRLEDEYIIYSGPSGTILRSEILSKQKKFIHVHPGWLPEFKGSTTIYYSSLLESKIGCSVIFLEKKIDEGPILYRKKYKITERNIDFDYTLDPLIRAKTLIEFFNTKKIEPKKQSGNGGNSVFYIIHPLLKHLSIIKHNNK